MEDIQIRSGGKHGVFGTGIDTHISYLLGFSVVLIKHMHSHLTQRIKTGVNVHVHVHVHVHVRVRVCVLIIHCSVAVAAVDYCVL
jgi:hypothetical protein